MEWYSGTGAGGQHRNKHQNSARVEHMPTGLVRSAQCRSREDSRREALSSLCSALDELEANSQAEEGNRARRAQVGLGERADRRRLWSFQRDCVEDFLTGQSCRCSDALKGQLDRLW